jgi:hypothetical protein
MPAEQDNPLTVARRYGLIGLILLLVVFLTPHAGSVQGRSFFKVASQSAWQDLWEWSAVWCSVKIILLCFGAFSLVLALSAIWMHYMAPRFVGWVLVLLSGGAFVGLVLGLYQLAKAIF